MPLTLPQSLDENWDNYEAGHFTILASQIAGNWLGYCFIMASNVCLIGLYNAQTMTCERSMSFFVEAVFPVGIVNLRHSKYRAVEYLFHKGKTGVAPIYILITASITSCLVWLPYAFLVEFNMLQMSFVCMLFLYSFIYLRIKRPNMPRPFKVPGGVKTSIFLALFPLGCTVLNVYFALTDNSEDAFEIPYFKVFAFEGLLTIGIIANFVYVRWDFLTSKVKRFFPSSNDDVAPLVRSASRSPDYTDLDGGVALLTPGKPSRGKLTFQGMDDLGGESKL